MKKLFFVLLCLLTVAFAATFNSLEEFKAAVYDVFGEGADLYYGAPHEGGFLYVEASTGAYGFPNAEKVGGSSYPHISGETNIVAVLSEKGDWLKLKTIDINGDIGDIGWFLNKEESMAGGGRYYFVFEPLDEDGWRELFEMSWLTDRFK